MAIAGKIRNLIGQGETRQALNELTKWLENKDDNLYNQLILLQGRYNQVERNSRMGIISYDEDSRYRNQINQSLLSILDEVQKIDQKTSDLREPAHSRQAPATGVAVQNEIKLFISYAREDEDWVRKLKNHMAALRRRYLESWDDSALVPGQDWDQEISRRLREANIILLMVSADFLNSDYIYEVELREAMERHQRGEAVVIPVILRPADWSQEPFARLQALPRGAMPIASWSNEDEALLNVVNGVKEVVDSLTRAKPKS